MVSKACKQCKFIHESGKCPNCGSEESTDSFKGKIIVIKPEESEISKNLNLKNKGTFAIRLG
jgi:DNA-directed RNA polymerase subunit E"